MLDAEGIAQDDVLLLTFSRVSAIDLRRKVGALARTPRASTVHSFALSFLLSEDNHCIRDRVDSILLEFQAKVVVADLQLIFPGSHAPELRRRLAEFSAGWATRPHDEVFNEDDDRRRFKAAVIGWLEEHKAAMMEEIIYHAVDLARQLGDTARFPGHILIDEFQDLNHLEQEFVDLIAANGQLLLVVGDPDQSIYSFKFAYLEGIVDFGRRDDVETHTSLMTGRCPKRIVEYANRLLVQSDPDRTALIEALPDAEEGEVHFVRKRNQEAEFAFVLRSISERLAAGSVPKEIIVLTPRRKLCAEFAQYATAHKAVAGIPEDVSIAPVQKNDLTETEQERLMLFGLLVRPTSLLHARTYIGLPDDRFYARELQQLKREYGNLQTVLERATSDGLPARSRVRRVCTRVEDLRAFLGSHTADGPIVAVLDELFPIDNEETRALRLVLNGLLEDGDTGASLYGKYVDYTRSIPQPERTVQVMTLMASKGLQADHVYIIGCNSGNVPGNNRSVHLTDDQHRKEQLRLLYVGFTRAAKSLTVSWARELPFRQARGHNTPAVRTTRRRGEPPVAVVALSECLQDLNVTWET